MVTQGQRRKYIKALKRRAEWLRKVLENWEGNDPNFAIAEHNALKWAIGLLEPLVNKHAGPAQPKPKEDKSGS